MNTREVRLQKFLAEAGICSRREAERHILDGRVSVNGKIIRTMGLKVSDKDKVSFDGKIVSPQNTRVYIILNKPRGVVSSCSHKGEKLVTDLVDLPQRIFPVGRLDKDSSGLIILTNDGPLHHRLSHPSFNHEKEYIVKTHPPLNDEALRQMGEGIDLDGRKTRKARVFKKDQGTFNIILKEGRNRQIRRMVAALGSRVTHLHRIRIDFLKLRHLSSGKWRYLEEKELLKLKKIIKETTS